MQLKEFKMNAEYYNYFWKASKQMAFVRKRKPSAIDSTLGGMSYDGTTFDEAIADTLTKVKIFEINENIKKLLALTDAPKINDEEYVRLPFDDIFLECQFTKEELEDYGVNTKYANLLKGIAVTRGNFIIKEEEYLSPKSLKEYENREKIGNGLRITMCSIWDKKGGGEEVLFDVFNKNVNLDEEYEGKKLEIIENPTSDRDLRDFIHKFVLNFLNFLNNPEVEYIEHKRSEGNIQRKIRQGKAIIPSTMSIRITGKLKEYIDDVESKGLWHYEYRFWVRGHYRDLRDEKYIEKKRIFIFPYIKGKGILIEKDYLVTGEKN
jgi:hypothetical protein